MKRIDPRYKLNTNIRHPEDVAAIKAAISELQAYSDAYVQELYYEYSEQYWAAGWIMLEVGLEEFKNWLYKELD